MLSGPYVARIKGRRVYKMKPSQRECFGKSVEGYFTSFKCKKPNKFFSRGLITKRELGMQ